MPDNITCESCGYSGTIDTYAPSMGLTSDCRCPKCGSTNNAHNREYWKQLQKAWHCKHPNVKDVPDRPDLLECEECGCTGLREGFQNRAASRGE
jgi:hypothetical protein